jgi:separase
MIGDTDGFTDVSTAITLRREMLESIEHKFSALHMSDDLQWPLITLDGTPCPQPKIERPGRFNVDLESDDDAEDGALREDTLIQAYWTSIREKYRSRRLDVQSLSTSETGDLPESWIVININITDDKSTLFISRREGGVEGSQPLVFCLTSIGVYSNTQTRCLGPL